MYFFKPKINLNVIRHFLATCFLFLLHILRTYFSTIIINLILHDDYVMCMFIYKCFGWLFRRNTNHIQFVRVEYEGWWRSWDVKNHSLHLVRRLRIWPIYFVKLSFLFSVVLTPAEDPYSATKEKNKQLK